MDIENRKWINENREALKEQYDGAIVIVCEKKVVKVIKDPITPIEIYEIASKICKDKDWDYTFICKKEEYLLLL